MFKKILEIVAKRKDSSNLITKILIKETFNVKKKNGICDFRKN